MIKKLISELKQETQVIIKGKKYSIKTKTWYTIEEDKTTSYVKCELSENKVLVLIPDDNLMYMGQVINEMNYKKISDEEISYKNTIFHKTGEGHQFITKIEFGSKDQVEGKCTFEDYESDNNIISLGILTDNKNEKADVYADILEMNDVQIQK